MNGLSINCPVEMGRQRGRQDPLKEVKASQAAENDWLH